MTPTGKTKQFQISDLLKPHWKLIVIGFLAVVGEGIADLLDPWPIKIVLDSVIKSKQSSNGWLNHLIASVTGNDRLATLEFAAIAVLVIAFLDAGCSYVEKYVTTSVGQWVTHDLRRILYAHIQRLSLSFTIKDRPVT